MTEAELSEKIDAVIREYMDAEAAKHPDFAADWAELKRREWVTPDRRAQDFRVWCYPFAPEGQKWELAIGDHSARFGSFLEMMKGYRPAAAVKGGRGHSLANDLVQVRGCAATVGDGSTRYLVLLPAWGESSVPILFESPIFREAEGFAERLRARIAADIDAAIGERCRCDPLAYGRRTGERCPIHSR